MAGQERVARMRFCVAGCGEAVLVFLQLLAKEIACGGPKEVEGEGSRFWWRLKVEGPKKVNVCGSGTLATVVEKKWSEMWDCGRWGH